MSEITFSQALDIGYGTLWDIRRKKPPLATYAYSTYQFFNTFFRGNVKTVGKALLIANLLRFMMYGSNSMILALRI